MIITYRFVLISILFLLILGLLVFFRIRKTRRLPVSMSGLSDIETTIQVERVTVDDSHKKVGDMYPMPPVQQVNNFVVPVQLKSDDVTRDSDTTPHGSTHRPNRPELSKDFHERSARIVKGDWYGAYRSFMTHEEISAEFPHAKGLDEKRRNHEG